MAYIGNVSGFDDVDTEQVKDGAISNVKISDVDHSKVTGLAAEISTAVSSLVDSSPDALNTLNELAAALGDDAAFSTTVTDNIALKLPLTGGAMTGAITTNSTFDGRDVSVDGSKLDNVEASADVTDTANVTSSGALMDSELTNITAVKALNQGVATTDAVDFTNVDLTAIAQSKSVTAVDVFVYDTSKDSDGGAWRKRTQGTSWYNETLNTSTRGSRKEFPAVAVIVAESNKVTIYDGDDPSMPMWMVFTQIGGWNYSLIVGTSNTSTGMLNARLLVGTAPNSQGLVDIDFILDRSQAHLTNGLYGGVDTAPLSLRNTSGHTFSTGTALGNPSLDIINNAVNDVAITVLPNAPIDSATGLPIPTIAVATNGGVSVIKDDGSVVDITHTQTYKKAKAISFKGNQISYATQQSGSGQTYWRKVYIDIPSADTSGVYASTLVGGTSYDARGVTGNKPALNTNPSLSDSSNDIVASIHDTAFAFNNKLTLLNVDKFSGTNHPSAPDSSVAYITSDYNTGYMVGDIKLAALSDTDSTNLGTELGGNAQLAGAARLASYTYTSGDLTFTLTEDSDSGTSSGYIRVNFNGVIGQAYNIDIQCDTAFTADNDTRLVDVASNVSVFAGQGTTALRSLTFVQTGSLSGVYFYGSPVAGSTVAYTISVKEADNDRSVNANGLAVHGTITKTPVATGADLVGYSGFSTSNFLVQPYISDLDFGTGDFSIMGWIKVGSNVSTYASILSRVLSTNTATNAWSLRIDSSANNYYFYTNNTSVFTSPLTRSTWQFLTVARRSGVVYFYVNGILRTTGPMANSITNVGASVVVGYEASHHLGNSSAALFRISATAPSAQQIKDIYEAERPLFQENAQATLYGTSDAVTALAHDDTTNLLHVGTSSGRSVFQGLQRVDNTTSAVGSAISASNNLVVED